MSTITESQDIDTSSEEIQYKEDCLNEKLTNEKIEGTPLWVIKNNEDGTLWTLAFGKYALKTGHSKQELKEYVQNEAMNVMTNIVICVVEELKNMSSNQKKDDSL